MPFRFGRAFLLLFKINTHRLPDEIVDPIFMGNADEKDKLKKCGGNSPHFLL